MNRGYIKLWRKSLESPLWANHNLWRFWTWCLLKASHKETTQLVGFQEVHLQPGEFIFGRKKAAKDTGLSEKNIRTSLSYLKLCSNVATTRASKFTIIRIENWDLYQGLGQVDGQETATKGPSNGHQTATNKNGKNVKNGKNNSSSIVTPDFLSSMKTTFPNVDVDLEWQHCQVWSTEHRKKPSQSRFMNWLKRAAERKGNNGATRPNTQGIPGNRPTGAFSDIPTELDL